ncbi:LysR family transcriptional regulator [Litoribacillus peritrichatus]|uniref:LysR family transcriptional regulator n=1 Tax=Litoribacillus peritrichatus TaxID=718191 RepID=A0ABP7N4K3_9GAMM
MVWKVIVRNLETIDFRTLSIFVTTCRLLSLTQCADEMGLPKSTVSKAISKLEEHLQAKLLERSTRRVQITEAGQVVLNRASHLVEEFNSLSEDVREIQQQVQGLIRISAPPAMGANLAQDIFPDFLKQWPKAQISLELSYAFDDLFVQGIDLALRVGKVVDDRLVAKEIGYSTRVLVASPQYLEEHGVPQTPEELMNHNCLRFQYSPDVTPWILVSGEKSVSLDISSNFYCSNIEAIKRATMEGMGIAQIPVNNMVCELKSRALVRILPQWHATMMPIYLVYRPGVNKPKRVEAILEYLVSRKEYFQFGPDHHLCQQGCVSRAQPE